MAGHSQFANIKHRKGAQDKKRAKIFTKLVREITVAAKGGDDPDGNPRLRGALIAARSQNLPKERIDNAIKKGSGADSGENYEEMRYEGYGAGGTAFIVEALTDNKNRTASSVRTIFSKASGSLGETGSVNFMFEHVGEIVFPATVASSDEIFEVAVELGAESAESDEEFHIITCAIDDFAAVRDGLVVKYGDPESAALVWQAKTPIEVDEEKAVTLLKMIDALEDDDDMQKVYHNFEIEN
jgi:YebC/PmpR family DNA-binding regulatory protein